MERPQWPKERIWEYRTTNQSAWNLTRPFLHALTSKRSDGKISYWFDWKVEEIPYGFRGLRLEGDTSAPKINSKLDELRMHFGMWKNGCVIAPRNEAEKEWQFSFLIPGSNPKQMSTCSIILEGPVKILIEPEPLTVYGSSLDHREIPIHSWGTRRRDLFDIPLI